MRKENRTDCFCTKSSWPVPSINREVTKTSWSILERDILVKWARRFMICWGQDLWHSSQVIQDHTRSPSTPFWRPLRRQRTIFGLNYRIGLMFGNCGRVFMPRFLMQWSQVAQMTTSHHSCITSIFSMFSSKVKTTMYLHNPQQCSGSPWGQRQKILEEGECSEINSSINGAH